MAFKPQSRQDTGWGLIYRLNNILAKIETDTENGDLIRWNLHLDRVIINILYKNYEEIIKDEKGKIIDIKLSKEDMEIFSLFNEKINKLKRDINISKNYEDKTKWREYSNQLYAILQKKNIWVVKKMFQLKLYLREGESDPRKAIYGA